MTATQKDARGRSARRPKVGRLTEADLHVGEMLRRLRLLAGLTQADLAAMVGVSFQQIQKYERGVDRIGAGRLLAISKALDVPVGSFFEGFDFEGSTTGRMVRTERDKTDLAWRERLEMVRGYNAVRNPEVRQSLRNLVKAISRMPEPTEASEPSQG